MKNLLFFCAFFFFATIGSFTVSGQEYEFHPAEVCDGCTQDVEQQILLSLNEKKVVKVILPDGRKLTTLLTMTDEPWDCGYTISREDINIEDVLSVNTFPNPFVTSFNLSVATKRNQRLTVVVYDVMGRQVTALQVAANEGNNQYEINIGDFSEGIYTLAVYGDEQQIVKKLVKSSSYIHYAR